MTARTTAPYCPSAQPDMVQARVFGVVVGTAAKPEVAYLKPEVTVDFSQIRDLHDAKVTEIFRIAAICEESRCAHFSGNRCTLGDRVVRQLEPVVDVLPPCTVRVTCRWFLEHGREICYRCPQVVTLAHRDDGNQLRVARPSHDPKDVGPPQE